MHAPSVDPRAQYIYMALVRVYLSIRSVQCYAAMAYGRAMEGPYIRTSMNLAR
jgi:hypothetical protein